ncbi:MAG: SGNH/GDSL hydrolase family protein [Pseudomonadota bacterium]
MKAPSPAAFWLQFLALLPVTGVQGLWIRQRAPRMATRIENGATGRVGAGERAIEVLVTGESTAVGVGCHTAEQAVSMQFASRLASLGGATVDWQVIGRNGARATDIVQLLATQRRKSPDPNRVAVVLLGANDVTSLHSLRHWYEQLVAVRTRLRQRGFGSIFLAPVPPMWGFTLLPRPLRNVLGARARQLEAERIRVASLYPDVTALVTDFPLDTELLAEDGYHPGPAACAMWGNDLAEQVLASLRVSPGPAAP